ncbi:MAG: hypothetical protein ACI4M6_05230 [Christensenellaceae bacterium]
MKSKFLIFVLSLLVCLAFTLSACQKGAPESAETSSDESVSSSQGTEELTASVTDRTMYNSENLLNEIKDYRFADNGVKFEEYLLTVTADYKVGDVFNMLLDSYDQNLGISTDFKKGFGFSLYDDGWWRTNFDRKKTHRLINGILNLNLDGKSKIEALPEDLETYKDTRLYTLFGYSQSVKDVVSSINPSLDALLTSTYGEIYSFAAGDAEAVKSVLSKIYLKDVLPIFGVEVTDSDLTLYQLVFVKTLPNGMTLDQFFNLSDEEALQAVYDMLVNVVYETVKELDSYMGEDLMVEGKTWGVCFAYINRILSASEEEQTLLLGDVESYINAHTFGYLSDLAVEILTNSGAKLDELLLGSGINVTCEQLKAAATNQFVNDHRDVVVSDYLSNTTLKVALQELGFDEQAHSSQTLDELLLNFGDVKLSDFKNLDQDREAKLKEIMAKLTLNDFIK